MKHAYTHNLDEETAVLAVNRAIEYYQEKFAEYSPTAEWVSDRRLVVSFSGGGEKLEGQLTVTPTEIEVSLEVPFLLRMFQEPAIAIIGKEINVWVDKAQNGELS
jgi:hypothetical protein